MVHQWPQLEPGIRWDPREPPPDVLQQLELEREVSRAQRWRSWNFHHIEDESRLQHRIFGNLTGDFANLQRAYDRNDGDNELRYGHNLDRQAERLTHHRIQVDEAAIPAPRGGFLPPITANVKAQIVHDIAKVTIKQLFYNDTNGNIHKASYTFPLPQGCTVTSFVCHLGNNQVLRGKVGPKGDARDRFNRAVRKNESAGLLEEVTPEIFTTTLGNIPVNTKVEVEISYIIILKFSPRDIDGLTTFILPLYIAPRFGTPPPGLAEALGTPATLRGLSVEVAVLAPEPISSLACISHSDAVVEMGVNRASCQSWREFAAAVQAAESRDPRSAFVRLPDAVRRLDRDFVLEILSKSNNNLEQPHACVEYHPNLENHRAVMLTIPTNVLLPSSTSTGSEIIFIADRSGSMTDKMAALKSAMEFFLKGIPSGWRFNIHCFGDHHESLFPSPVEYSDCTLQHALDYVGYEFQADMGGTKLLPALMAAVNNRNPGLTTDIVVLTDGQVWDLNATLDFVRTSRTMSGDRIRFFSLGIGTAVSHALVEGIAKFGGGYAEVIPLASHGGWESRVVAVLKAALAGKIGPIRLEVELGIEGTAPQEPRVHQTHNYVDERFKMMQSPATVSTLSPFVRNRVFIIYEELPKSAPLSGLHLHASLPDGEEFTVSVPIKVLNMPDTTIHKLAARALLGDLERGESNIHLHPESLMWFGEPGAVQLEGERLGCKWELVSKWTSFYAVQERFQPDPGDGSTQDSSLNGSNPWVEAVDQSNSGLLRPRGPRAGSTFRNRPADANEETEDRDSDGSEDEEESSQDRNYDTRDGNNDDEGGGPGGGGGGGGGADYGVPPANPPSPQPPRGPNSSGAARSSDGTSNRNSSGQPYPSLSGFGGRQHPADVRDISIESLRLQSIAQRASEPRGRERTGLYPEPVLPFPVPTIPDFDMDYGDIGEVWGRTQKTRDSKSERDRRVPDLLSDTYGRSRSDSKRTGFTKAEEAALESAAARIEAPNNNLPSSRAMLPEMRRDLVRRSSEHRACENYISELLQCQNYDGSFTFTETAKKTLLHDPFVEAVEQFGNNLQNRSWDISNAALYMSMCRIRKIADDVAMALAIVVLLRKEFPDLHDLWEMMVDKAESFIRSKGLGIIDDLLEEMRSSLSGLTARCRAQAKAFRMGAPRISAADDPPREEYRTRLRSRRAATIKPRMRSGQSSFASAQKSTAEPRPPTPRTKDSKIYSMPEGTRNISSPTRRVATNDDSGREVEDESYPEQQWQREVDEVDALLVEVYDKKFGI